ncbi:tyrosine-type recombinase/integrase [Christensenellaceae bacterium OttesenSCG-928-L17]|nr:tyrosine-type recombinase/integrase [Christensenellaceae bacterium OttesenSCG-928-L17]
MAKPIFAQVEEYLTYCRDIRQMSKMTLNSKKHTYKHFIVGSECRDLKELDNVDFNRWISYQTESGVSARTINTRMAHVLSMLRYFREMGMDMPIKLPLINKLKEGPARRVFYSRETIENVLSYADDLAWLLVKISFDAGLRISELRNLSLTNMFGRRIKFIGKGNKDRESYISEEAKQKLDQWIVKNNVTDYIWVNERGRHYSVDELRIRMRKPFEEAGFDNFYPHALRHSFGTDIQKKGASILEMQQMLGHSNAETTQRYIHGLDGKLGSLFEKYKDGGNPEKTDAPDRQISSITDEMMEKALMNWIKKQVQSEIAQ